MSTVERALNPSAVKLDDSLLHDIRAQLGVAGVVNCASFVLVELCERGLLTAVVDAGTGVRLVERSDSKLGLRMLDLAIADHLVRTGRVERPESAEWADELIVLVTELRGRLATGDGAFAMGADHIGLLRISRRDVIAALHPHLMAAQNLWQGAALHAESPVGAIVFMPDHLQWPGLFATLAQLTTIPAVAVADPATTAAHAPSRHGVAAPTPNPVMAPNSVVAPNSVIAPEPVAPDTVVAEPVAAPTEPGAGAGVEAEVEPEVEAETGVPVPSAPSSAAEPAEVSPVPESRFELPAETRPLAPVESVPVVASANEPTPVFASLAFPVPAPVPSPPAPPPAPPMPAAVPQQAPAGSAPVYAAGTQSSWAPAVPGMAAPVGPPQAHTGFAGMRLGTTHEQDVYFGSRGARGPISVHDHRDVKQPGGPRHYSPPVPVASSTSPEARRVHNRRLLIGAAVVAGSAAVGVVVLALPWLDQDGADTPGQIITAQTSAPQLSTVVPTSPVPVRTPIDTGAARGPATQYTAPPPAQTPTAQAPTRAPARRRAAPARPRPRSIPNPIPGLPPILLP